MLKPGFRAAFARAPGLTLEFPFAIASIRIGCPDDPRRFGHGHRTLPLLSWIFIVARTPAFGGASDGESIRSLHGYVHDKRQRHFKARISCGSHSIEPGGKSTE